MTTVSFRIEKALARQAEREARIQNRSKAKQLEYWAKIGKVMSSKLNIADVFAVSQGIKTIKLEASPSAPLTPVDADAVFNDLEENIYNFGKFRRIFRKRIIHGQRNHGCLHFF